LRVSLDVEDFVKATEAGESLDKLATIPKHSVRQGASGQESS